MLLLIAVCALLLGPYGPWRPSPPVTLHGLYPGMTREEAAKRLDHLHFYGGLSAQFGYLSPVVYLDESKTIVALESASAQIEGNEVLKLSEFGRPTRSLKLGGARVKSFETPQGYLEVALFEGKPVAFRLSRDRYEYLSPDQGFALHGIRPGMSSWEIWVQGGSSGYYSKCCCVLRMPGPDGGRAIGPCYSGGLLTQMWSEGGLTLDGEPIGSIEALEAKVGPPRDGFYHSSTNRLEVDSEASLRRFSLRPLGESGDPEPPGARTPAYVLKFLNESFGPR